MKIGASSRCGKLKPPPTTSDYGRVYELSWRLPLERGSDPGSVRSTEALVVDHEEGEHHVVAHPQADAEDPAKNDVVDFLLLRRLDNAIADQDRNASGSRSRHRGGPCGVRRPHVC